MAEKAHVITDLGSGITEAGLIPPDFNREYLFHVRFHSDGYREIHQRRIKFIAKSWDEITFERCFLLLTLKLRVNIFPVACTNGMCSRTAIRTTFLH